MIHINVFVVAALLQHFHFVSSCAGGGIGGGGILTNPSLTMKFHSPTSWTYPDQNALTALSYFPGQSLTQTEAQLRANGDINSAVLAGLQALQIPTTNVKVTPSYTPPLVSDCVKVTTGATETAAGMQIGYEEGGAITKLITAPTAGITPENCIIRAYAGASATVPLVMIDFPQQASVKIDGITLSEYQATLLGAKVSQYLMLNSKVDFIEEITVD